MTLEELLQLQERTVRESVDRGRREVQHLKEQLALAETRLQENGKLQEELVSLLIAQDITPLT